MTDQPTTQPPLPPLTPPTTPTLTPTPIGILSPTDIPDFTEHMSLSPIENQETRNTEYIISTGLLATALMVCVVVFIIVTSVILIRSKAKIKAALQQSASPGETMNMEPMYEDITRSLPSASDLNTQVNVAYGHTQTTAR
jgi:flagellar biosynthesis/type III secretory pathway M-ring protein FliF/YscJ